MNPKCVFQSLISILIKDKEILESKNWLNGAIILQPNQSLLSNKARGESVRMAVNAAYKYSKTESLFKAIPPGHFILN